MTTKELERFEQDLKVFEKAFEKTRKKIQEIVANQTPVSLEDALKQVARKNKI